MSNRTPRVAVVGGGISGLAAAHALVRSGRVSVTVFEADRRLGGKIRSESIAGQRIDVGAESLFARTPVAIELCRELGLADELIAARQTATAVWTRGRLRELPGNILGGLPDGTGPVLRSGILSPLGLARAGLDLLLPTSDADGDRSVGELVRGRLGRQALDRLVDPLLGTIYATDCDELSARATAPQLDALARGHRSLIMGMRAARPAQSQAPAGPLFVTLPGGLERIVARLGERLREADIRRNAPVTLLRRSPDGRYELETGDQGPPPRDEPKSPDLRPPLRLDEDEAGPGRAPLWDGVVIATPHDQAAQMLRDLSPRAAGELRLIGWSSTVVVTLRYAAPAFRQPRPLAGFLVPRGERRLLGACTWLSCKWPHLAATGELWLRCSVGRAGTASALALDDTELVARLTDELREAMGLSGKPLDTHVTRWERALPRYEPGHLDRVGRIDDALAGLPGLALAGAAYRGMGVPQCIAQGQAAAERVLAGIPRAALV